MTQLILKWTLDWLIGWGGLSLLVALGAGAIWWFIPRIFTNIRAVALNVAIGALAFNAVYTTGYQNGAATTRREWTDAEARTIEHGADVRRNAEQEIEAVPETPPVAGNPVPVPRGAVPRWMRDDRHNRDNR